MGVVLGCQGESWGTPVYEVGVLIPEVCLYYVLLEFLCQTFLSLVLLHHWRTLIDLVMNPLEELIASALSDEVIRSQST